jgi:hypothetical protein
LPCTMQHWPCALKHFSQIDNLMWPAKAMYGTTITFHEITLSQRFFYYW